MDEDFADRNGVKLTLEGECGFGRECVGIIGINEHYVSYAWDLNEDTWEYDGGSDGIFKPENAYGKHPCVAVLGRDNDSINQLYEWLKWFEENGYEVETKKRVIPLGEDPIETLFKSTHTVRMVKS